MQIFGLHKNIYRINSYRIRQESKEKYIKLCEEITIPWESLKKNSLKDNVISDITKISRATYYRKKSLLLDLKKGIFPTPKPKKRIIISKITTEIRNKILSIRKENPTYGKNKIFIILKRDHDIDLSESSVGRVLKDFMEKGIITKSISAPRVRKKRRFKGHAQKWNYNMKASTLGEMVQVDHMTVTKNQITVKHFQAWDPLSKRIDAQIYSNANSKSAKRFLEYLESSVPYKIKSIQVDGGSEFMKEFEDACMAKEISLYVLPPKRPQYNGGVERGNRTFREEFYDRRDLLADSLGALRIELSKAINKYNNFRPHFNLKGLTPMQYINTVREAA